jgi:hypothetical protein
VPVFFPEDLSEKTLIRNRKLFQLSGHWVFHVAGLNELRIWFWKTRLDKRYM